MPYQGKAHVWAHIRRWLLLAVYFLLLTLVFTRPLYNRLATHTAGGYGDNLYFIWQIGWFRQALFDLHELPLHSHLLNWPHGYSLATTEISPLQIAMALPLAAFGQPVLGYNIAMLASFVLAGLLMTYWVESLTGSRGAALVAGTAYAFMPYHQAQFLIGHLNIAAIQWFPLYFMGLFAILASHEFKWQRTILLAVGLSGIALSSQYYLYMALLAGVVIVGVRLLIIRPPKTAIQPACRQLLAAGGLALPGLVVGILPYLRVHAGASAPRTLENVMQFSASPTDFLLPFTKSVFAGRWVADHFPRDLWNEATLYIGLVVLVLAIFGLARRAGSADEAQTPLRGMLITGMLTALVLAMGTNLAWMEQPLLLRTPHWLAGLVKTETFPLFLPGYLLFKYLPFYSLMRVWMRWGVILLCLACAAAGLGAARLLEKLAPKWRTLAALLLTLLVIADFISTPFGISRIQPRAVDLWLAGQPFGGQAQLPLHESYEESAIYFTLTSQKPLIGVIRTFPSNRYFELEPKLRGFPDAASLQALRGEQVTYVVVNEKEYSVDSAFIAAAEGAGYRYAGSFDGQSVFVIP